MGNRRLEVQAYAKFAEAPVWHALISEERESACGIFFDERGPCNEVAEYEIRAPHTTSTIDTCSVCEDEIRQSAIGATARV